MTDKTNSKKPRVDIPATHTVWLKPSSYQPNKEELEEDMRVGATPEQLADAVLRPVVVKRLGIRK